MKRYILILFQVDVQDSSEGKIFKIQETELLRKCLPSTKECEGTKGVFQENQMFVAEYEGRGVQKYHSILLCIDLRSPDRQ